MALLFIDLDDFKEINDTYGHDAGDFVLIKVAERLVECVRESDFVGRLGGDEFVVCLDLLNDFDIVPMKVEQIKSAINEPIVFDERNLKVGASVGVSQFPDHTKNKEALVCLADEAMYLSKRSKPSNCEQSLAGQNESAVNEADGDDNVVNLVCRNK